MESSTLLKVIDVFSRNWLVVLVIILCMPLMKEIVRACIDIKIAKITNHQKVVLHVENELGRKTLEISTSDLDLKDLQKQFGNFENNELIGENEKSKKMII